MSNLITKIKLKDHEDIGPASELNQILSVLLIHEEGSINFNEAELTALRLWALQRACRLPPEHEVSIESKIKPDIKISAGMKKSGKVFVSDSEYVFETMASSIVFLR